MPTWRSVSIDLPWWKDTGVGELRRADGTTESCMFDIVDVVSTADPEIPIFEFTATDGRKLDIHSFEEWRLTAK